MARLIRQMILKISKTRPKTRRASDWNFLNEATTIRALREAFGPF